MRLVPFSMERYQSIHEHRVRINLTESGVHPLTTAELLDIAAKGLDIEVGGLAKKFVDVRLGYGQSNGSDPLRERIAMLYAGAHEGSILVTVGSAEANFASFWYLLEKVGRAAVVVPTYGQVPGLVESFENRFERVPLIEEDAWQPDLEALEKALQAGARFVLVTNPNNPTGAALSAGAMEEIADSLAPAG